MKNVNFKTIFTSTETFILIPFAISYYKYFHIYMYISVVFKSNILLTKSLTYVDVLKKHLILTLKIKI